MKLILYTLILSTLIYSCSITKTKTMKEASTSMTSDTLKISNDSLEYEILIIEPGFNSWLVTQKPRGFYSESYLENRNRQYVIEYNQRVSQPQRYDSNLYEQQINYDQGTHYGYEVNYLLYNYFLFFERQYKQRFSRTRG